MQEPSLPTRWMYILSLGCVCAVGFHGLPGQPWSYDDLEYIAQARAAQADLGSLFSEGGSARWMLGLYFYLTYLFLDDAPGGYHLLNVIFHVLNSYLCARLFLVLYHNLPAAALTGFLFAINCTGYEAVYGISSSGVLLGSAMMLVCVIRAHTYLISGRRVSLLLSVGAYGVGLLFDTSLALVFLPILVLWGNRSEKRETDRLPISFLAILGCLVVMDVLVYRASNLGALSDAFQMDIQTLYHLAFLTGRLFVSAYITPISWDGAAPFDVTPHHFGGYAIVGGLILILLFRVGQKRLRFWAVWIVSMCIPYASGTVYFSRCWYLAAAGGSAVLARVLTQAYAVFPGRIRQGVGIAFLVLLAFSSFYKMARYEGQLLMHAATFYLTHQKDPETAIDHYLRARSDYGIELPNLYANLGTAYLRQAQLNEAQAALEKAVQIKPDYAVALRNLSLAFDRQGRLGEAVRAFIQATEIQRDYLPELKRLGHDLVGHGNIEEAHQVYRALMDLAPDSGFYAELGVMLLEHESVQ